MTSLTQEAAPEAAPENPERPNVLARIEAYKRREIAEAKLRMPLAKLEKKVAQADPPRGFAEAIRKHRKEGRPADRRGEEGLAVQGADPRRFRPRHFGGSLREGRGDLPVGPD